MTGCSKSLAIFLKERHSKNVEEMSNLADKLIEAHGYSAFSKDIQVFQKNTSPETQRRNNQSSNPTYRSRPDPQQIKDRKCYLCYRSGHIAKDWVFSGRNRSTREHNKLIKEQQCRATVSVNQCVLIVNLIFYSHKCNVIHHTTAQVLATLRLKKGIYSLDRLGSAIDRQANGVLYTEWTGKACLWTYSSCHRRCLQGM